tara:strand:- start:18 stop:755 length:738 start_codon:yes stop_codon:yes gene_type:complete
VSYDKFTVPNILLQVIGFIETFLNIRENMNTYSLCKGVHVKAILMAGLMVASSVALAEYGVPAAVNVQFTGSIDLTSSGVRSRRGNDIWGWTDPQTGKEYAIMGLNNKSSIVDITNPSDLIHVADIKTQTWSSTWRDMKVYKDHAYIVSEAFRHGMQVFDLTRLRNITSGKMPVTLKPDVHYNKYGNAHNIFINEETGYAYSVGTSTCDGGLHISNIQDPKNPTFVNCIGRGVYELLTCPPNLLT